VGVTFGPLCYILCAATSRAASFGPNARSTKTLGAAVYGREKSHALERITVLNGGPQRPSSRAGGKCFWYCEQDRKKRSGLCVILVTARVDLLRAVCSLRVGACLQVVLLRAANGGPVQWLV